MKDFKVSAKLDGEEVTFTSSHVLDKESWRTTFILSPGEDPILQLGPGHDIFVRGKLAATDQEVVEGMRAFLQAANSRVLLAAPSMLRALLLLKWSGGDAWCPECMAGHEPGCSLDAALSEAGYDTQEKRVAARKSISR